MLYLHGAGHFYPDNLISNAFLASLDIGVDERWIIERVGIHNRRTVLPLDYISATRNRDPRAAHEAAVYSNALTGAAAARLALERAGLPAEAIGLVIAGSCSPQYSIPAEACRIAAELGLEVPCFDLNSACSSFAAQLHLLNGMMPESLPDYALLVCPENNTRTVDYSDRRSAVLWGDGTAALIVSKKVPSNIRIIRTTFTSSPAGWQQVTIPASAHFQQNGNAVQAFAVRKTIETIKALCNARGLEPERTSFIGHQANLRMLQSVCERVGISPSRHYFNVDQFGNCGAASAPGVLSQFWKNFSAGDHLVMAMVGSGLAWGGMMMDFT